MDQAKGHSACHIVSYLWVGKERVTAVTKWAEICPIPESKVLAALRVLASVALGTQALCFPREPNSL